MPEEENPLRVRTGTLPTTPGVYLFRDGRNRVLYIGKAKNLKKRVLQYADARRLDPVKRDMAPRIRRIETIVTKNEPEALALEASLIHRHRPPYNVRLVDDSGYLYIKITDETYPRVSLTRAVLPDGAWYRGPFPSACAVRQTLKEARKAFPWCASKNPRAGGRACFASHLRLCPGICAGAISLEEYQRMIQGLKRFLDGDTRAVLAALRARMEDASSRQDYERAADARDRIRAIERTMTPQHVVTPRRESTDVIGIARRGTHAAAAVLSVRQGRVTGTQTFSLLHPSDEPTARVLRGFLLQYYGAATGPTPEIVLPERPEDAEAMERWVRDRSGTRTALTIPRRGWRKRLLTLAEDNARAALARMATELESPANLRRALADLARVLRLENPPARIEAYDISNIHGTLATGSMIVFDKGKPAPSQYRAFRIVSKEAPNDVGMMAEVLRRRFSRHGREARSAWPLPDLVLLDGGKAQRNAGMKVLTDLGVTLPLAALAKRDEELFVPGRLAPIVLPRASPALYLLQRVRDEAHRFTLGYHRLLRKKRMTRSILEEIPGVGNVTRKNLLRAFGSLAKIRAAEPEELARVVGKRTAETIRAFLAATERGRGRLCERAESEPRLGGAKVGLAMTDVRAGQRSRP